MFSPRSGGGGHLHQGQHLVKGSPKGVWSCGCPWRLPSLASENCSPVLCPLTDVSETQGDTQFQAEQMYGRKRGSTVVLCPVPKSMSGQSTQLLTRKRWVTIDPGGLHVSNQHPNWSAQREARLGVDLRIILSTNS